jgi:hypothetical protein
MTVARSGAGLLLLVAAVLTGCQTAPEADTPTPIEAWTDGWHALKLPGKRPTHYVPTRAADGRWVLHARADRSASLYRRKLHVLPDQLGDISFGWKVNALPHGADVRQADVEDAPVRVVLAFDGDSARLSQRTRMMFDLMHTVSGEAPPYATLMYVWDGAAPVGTLVINRRSDRVRQIVLESGTTHLGRWRSYTRDIRSDYRHAFGEEPGPLIGIAVMTDTDNTATRAEAWYAQVRLSRAPGSAP